MYQVRYAAQQASIKKEKENHVGSSAPSKRINLLTGFAVLK